MNITEVKIRLIPPNGRGGDRLLAFCAVVFDGDFVVHDIKVIGGPNGIFIASPSRRICDHCPGCKGKNHLLAKFCNECGSPLEIGRVPLDGKLYYDIAHPINSTFRQDINDAVLGSYRDESKRTSTAGYDYTWATYDFLKEGVA